MLEIIKNSKKITLANIDNEKSAIKGTSRELIMTALEKKIAVYRVFEKRGIFILKDGEKIEWLYESLASQANPIGMIIARNKHSSKKLLTALGYPTAQSKIVKTVEELNDAIKEIEYPVVIKPLRSGGGKGITVNIVDYEVLLNSFNHAKDFDTKILIEKYVFGDYYRLTYIADGSFAVTKNLPAIIIGDGEKTAKELINKENKTNPERRRDGRLKKIKTSGKTERFLTSYGYTLNSIIPKNKTLPLCFSGFDGGEYIDVTDEIHQYYIKLAKKISENLGLPIIGLDIIAKNITKPLTENGGVLIEINGTYPDIQFHSMPTSGKPRYLAPKLINYLFRR